MQAAEGLAEWLHAEVRRGLGIELDQGRRYSWGYPACPDQSEHEKVERLLGLREIGMTLSGGHAVEPEQSTAAIIAHHPQAVYFGMKSGFIPAEKKGDELIAGTDRGGELPPEADPRATGRSRRRPSEADGPGDGLSAGQLGPEAAGACDGRFGREGVSSAAGRRLNDCGGYRPETLQWLLNPLAAPRAPPH